MRGSRLPGVPDLIVAAEHDSEPILVAVCLSRQPDPRLGMEASAGQCAPRVGHPDGAKFSSHSNWPRSLRSGRAFAFARRTIRWCTGLPSTSRLRADGTAASDGATGLLLQGLTPRSPVHTHLTPGGSRPSRVSPRRIVSSRRIDECNSVIERSDASLAAVGKGGQQLGGFQGGFAHALDVSRRI